VQRVVDRLVTEKQTAVEEDRRGDSRVRCRAHRHESPTGVTGDRHVLEIELAIEGTTRAVVLFERPVEHELLLFAVHLTGGPAEPAVVFCARRAIGDDQVAVRGELLEEVTV